MPRSYFVLQKLGHPLHTGMSASTTTSLNWTRRAFASGGGHDAYMDTSFRISHNAFTLRRILRLTNMFRFARWKRFEVYVRRFDTRSGCSLSHPWRNAILTLWSGFLFVCNIARLRDNVLARRTSALVRSRGHTRPPGPPHPSGARASTRGLGQAKERSIF